MTKQKSLIGMQLHCSSHTIEASQLNRLKNALYQPNAYLPAQNDAEFAKKPINQMPTFLLGNLIDLPTIYKTLGLTINNVLLSRESIICHSPISVGDSVTVKTFLKDAYEQQATSNPIGFIILESIGEQKSDIAFFCERVLAVRGGFQRGRF